MSKARFPARSFAPAFKLWDIETALMRMRLQISQPWSHRLGLSGCDWLESAKNSWGQGPQQALRLTKASRRLPMVSRRRAKSSSRRILKRSQIFNRRIRIR